MRDYFDQIWQNWHQNLEQFIVSRVHDPEVAKDIMQEVFLRVHTHLPSLREENKLIPWIYQITRNLITDFFRSQKKSVIEKTVDGWSIPDAEENQDSYREMETFAQCIIPMIDNLPKNYQEALFLADIQGLSQKALAEKLNISYSGAKSRVQRAREKLKALLLDCCAIDSDRYGNIVDCKPKRYS